MNLKKLEKNELNKDLMELNKKLMELNKKLPLIKDNMDVDISKKTNLLNDITRLKKLSLINTVFEDDEVINLKAEKLRKSVWDAISKNMQNTN